MPKAVIEAYKKAGYKPPKGGRKGKHKRLAAHKAVINYMKKGLSKNEAWKRVMGGFGKKVWAK